MWTSRIHRVYLVFSTFPSGHLAITIWPFLLNSRHEKTHSGSFIYSACIIRNCRLLKKSNGELSNKWEVQFLPWFLCQYRARSLTLWKMARWLRNSLMRDKKTELEILLSYRFRMVLITGCPLLNVKKREIPDFFWKGRKQFDPFVQPMGLKQSYQRNCWFAVFYLRLGKTRFFSFFGSLAKAILENLHGSRLIYIVPIRKSLRLFGGNVVEWLVRWTCNSVTPSWSPARTASWICFTVVPSSDPRPLSWIADGICRRPVWIFNP